MLKSRIIPTLLIKDKGLVKSTNFKDFKYVGDPLNAVRIFNEKNVDELIVLAIDATANGVEPDFKLIEHLAAECRMPLCYGGGITTVEQAGKILSLGVEKISLGSAAIENPELIQEMSRNFGAQSISVVLDVKKRMLGSKYYCFIKNATQNSKLDPVDFALKCQRLGAGEIVLNSIDQDGTMQGYDIALIGKLRSSLTIPLTVMGGAGSFEELKKINHKFYPIGMAAGSLFVFKGKYRAVLISYPTLEEKSLVLD
ncbi:MAG: imidazole glycerol phosphate synthase subunit HisF [Halobacteriovoraceae bacterium]|nr:imidazole glycerol phosphate synthase subunit HisF [Halobacteriovoraceae bacterium]|tara:strand:+ start:10785 stop:11549 length:765 start_codon:yes stop_codon:yes gene_type:complete